ncbi:MAG: hypothetical protein ACLSH6_01095 [Limosilactobacillus pontis]
MPDGIIGNNFDKFLEKADRGFTLGERKKVNKVGDKVYEKAMQSFLDAHRRHVVYKDGTQHLADTLTHEIKEDGHYEIGFSKRGRKLILPVSLTMGGGHVTNSADRMELPIRPSGTTLLLVLVSKTTPKWVKRWHEEQKRLWTRKRVVTNDTNR